MDWMPVAGFKEMVAEVFPWGVEEGSVDDSRRRSEEAVVSPESPGREGMVGLEFGAGMLGSIVDWEFGGFSFQLPTFFCLDLVVSP